MPAEMLQRLELQLAGDEVEQARQMTAELQELRAENPGANAEGLRNQNQQLQERLASQTTAAARLEMIKRKEAHRDELLAKARKHAEEADLYRKLAYEADQELAATRLATKIVR